MNIKSIKINPRNPRIIKDEKFKKLVNSIKEFPKMMELRPIVVDDDNIVLGGNMRLKALEHLKYTEIPDSWVKKASELTEEEKKRFIVADNVGFGDWNWDILANEWDEVKLIDWGLDLPKQQYIDDLSESIKTKYIIEIECDSEESQEKNYNELTEKGYKCRVLTL